MILNKKHKALTLIEALIWFAIFAAVVAGVFALYGSSRDANSLSRVNKEMASMFTKANSLYAANGSDSVNGTDGTSGATVNEVMMQMGVIPASLKIIGGTAYNEFGGTVKFANRTNGFVIIYTKIPSGKMCANIIKAQKAIGWNFIVIGAINRVTFDDNYDYNQIVTYCKGEGGVAAGTIDLQFASCTNC